MSSSDLQIQIDALTTIFSSDFFSLIFNAAALGVVFLFLVLHLIDFLDSLSRYHFNRRATNHCDDLHKGVKQGHCHYERCTFRAGCPYFEKLTLRKRWQLFRAKKNKPD